MTYRYARTTRLLGHMVTRNELDRYLKPVIDWLVTLTDGHVHVHDDRSTDDTYEYLRGKDFAVTQRQPTATSFAQDESAFRTAAWQQMEAHLKPTTTDWVLCIDADEFLFAPDVSATRDTVTDTIEEAIIAERSAVTFPVNEVWGTNDDGNPLIRVDGFWGAILACRLVRWRPAFEFDPRIEGGGSVPTAWRSDATLAEHLSIMHLGYARPADRVAKHARYSATTGHNPRHIASILEPPRLAAWPGVALDLI